MVRELVDEPQVCNFRVGETGAHVLLIHRENVDGPLWETAKIASVGRAVRRRGGCHGWDEPGPANARKDHDVGSTPWTGGPPTGREGTEGALQQKDRRPGRVAERAGKGYIGEVQRPVSNKHWSRGTKDSRPPTSQWPLW